MLLTMSLSFPRYVTTSYKHTLNLLLTAIQLPDSIHEFVRNLKAGKSASKHILTHCKRELFQAVWFLIMDEEFMQAYEHGIVIECADGIFRRVYPRIFIYSADYPEKYVTFSDIYCIQFNAT
jgi:hypothetical protein